MLKLYKCCTCKHYIRYDGMIPKCKAYPNGIPLEIFREEVDHTQAYNNDNGIQYEKADDISK